MSNSNGIADLGEVGLHYRARILITHPDSALDTITTALAITPKAVWKKGQKRVDPRGVELPGAHQSSAWSYWVDVEDSRDFSLTVSALARELEKGSDVFRSLFASGGHGVLMLDLRGDRNIGDVISPEDLRFLGNLGFGLGVEVFPG